MVLLLCYGYDKDTLLIHNRTKKSCLLNVVSISCNLTLPAIFGIGDVRPVWSLAISACN